MIISENGQIATSENNGRSDVNSGFTCIWPQMPSMPSPGRPLVLRVPTSRLRQAARKEMRNVLREVLSKWSYLPAENLPLDETAHGACWRGKFCGHALDISLSYSVDEGWIGLILDGHIGIDVMTVEEFPEMENVASTYLEPDVASSVLNAQNPSLAFASAWTEREARLKCLKSGLVEWSAEQGAIEGKCSCRKLVISNSLVGAVATR